MKLISESALVKRMNRRLRHHGMVLRISAYGARSYQGYGRCFMTPERGGPVTPDVDLEQLGREWRALKASESLIQDE